MTEQTSPLTPKQKAVLTALDVNVWMDLDELAKATGLESSGNSGLVRTISSLRRRGFVEAQYITRMCYRLSSAA